MLKLIIMVIGVIMVNFGNSHIDPLQRAATDNITKALGESKLQRVSDADRQTASMVAQKAIKKTDEITASIPNIEAKAAIVNKELDKAAVWLSYTPKGAKKGKEEEIANPLSGHRNAAPESKVDKSKTSDDTDFRFYEDEGPDQIDPRVLAEIYKDGKITDDYGKPDEIEGDSESFRESTENEVEPELLAQIYDEHSLDEDYGKPEVGIETEASGNLRGNETTQENTASKRVEDFATSFFSMKNDAKPTLKDNAVQIVRDLAFKLWRQISRHTSPTTGQNLSRFFVSTKLVKIESMDPQMISRLSPKHMGKVPLDQLKQLDLAQLKKMSNEQLLAMKPENIAQMPTRSAAYIMGRFDNDTRLAMYLTLHEQKPILANQLQAAYLTRKPPLIEVEKSFVAGIFEDKDLTAQAVVKKTVNDQEVSTPVTVVVDEIELPVLDQFNKDANRNEFILNGKKVEVGNTVSDVTEALYESTNKDPILTQRLQVFLNQGPSITPTLMTEINNNFIFGSVDPLNVEFTGNRHEYSISSGVDPISGEEVSMIEINSSYILEVKDKETSLGFATETLTIRMPLQDFKEGRSEKAQTTVDLSPLFFTKTGEGIIATDKNRAAAENYRSAPEAVGGSPKSKEKLLTRKTAEDKESAIEKLEKEVSQKYDHFDAVLLAEMKAHNLGIEKGQERDDWVQDKELIKDIIFSALSKYPKGQPIAPAEKEAVKTEVLEHLKLLVDERKLLEKEMKALLSTDEAKAKIEDYKKQMFDLIKGAFSNNTTLVAKDDPRVVKLREELVTGSELERDIFGDAIEDGLNSHMIRDFANERLKGKAKDQQLLSEIPDVRIRQYVKAAFSKAQRTNIDSPINSTEQSKSYTLAILDNLPTRA